MPKKFLIFIVALALTNSAGLVGSFFTFDAIPTWYASLEKPFFNPPSWIFGPAWTLLYFLMAVALYQVLQLDRRSGKVKLALVVFGIQLVLNAIWSIIFFGLQNPAAAGVEIIVLNLFIWLTIYEFYNIKKSAAYFLLPYAAWVAFATILNIAIWRLN